MTTVQDLSGAWELHGDGVGLPATVPGCVHADLFALAIPAAAAEDTTTGGSKT